MSIKKEIFMKSGLFVTYVRSFSAKHTEVPQAMNEKWIEAIEEGLHLVSHDVCVLSNKPVDGKLEVLITMCFQG